jgi:hypothetical protein
MSFIHKLSSYAAASEAELGLPNAEGTSSSLFAHKRHTQKHQQQQQQQQCGAASDERQYELPLKDITQVSNRMHQYMCIPARCNSALMELIHVP